MEKYISEDLFMEILSKLTAKSLLRFMSVHRSWYSLIKNPNFIYKQYRKPFSSNNTILLRLNPHQFSFCTNDYDFDETRLVSISACNGLIRIFHKKEKIIILWNLSIRKIIRLPKPNSAPPSGISQYGTNERGEIIGFGFDSLTNDFKVVYLNTERTFFAEVYSVKEVSWRQIGNVAPVANAKFRCRSTQVFANNKLYWLMSERFVQTNSFVLVFDLGQGFFRRITPPDPCLQYHSSLHCLRWSIALIVDKSFPYFDDRRDINVFVMKDSGKVNSWKKTSANLTGWRVLGFRRKRRLLMVKEREYFADFQRRYLSNGRNIADFNLRDFSVVGKYEEDNLALLDNENVEGDARLGWDVCDDFVTLCLDSWRS